MLYLREGKKFPERYLFFALIIWIKLSELHKKDAGQRNKHEKKVHKNLPSDLRRLGDYHI